MGEATVPRGLPAKRAAVMAAAEEAFIQDGFSGASLDKIAASAGVSKQTIYNHFSDKRGLFLAVVEAARIEVDAQSSVDDSLLRTPDRLEEDLTAVGRQLLQVLLDERLSALRRLLITEVARHPELGDRCGGSGGGTVPRAVEWLTLRLAVLTVSGVLAVADPEEAASQFVALLSFPGQQLTSYGTRRLSDEEIEKLATSAATFFLRAYRAAPVD
ncbi:TetR/AcrR family transcriptional regulator [Streptomyces sp. NPDC014983]|uniref:TetR/AcrR family transcriptional regulator n=1 Tax=unclassified Streptomyces TaxID=2593676 RepID=UPI00331CAB18